MRSTPFLCTFIVLIVGCAALSVSKISDGKIVTFRELVKLQGIDFLKRYVNRSLLASVKFRVHTDVHPDNLSLAWFAEGEKLKVVRFQNVAPENPGDVYSTEEQHNNSVDITLNVKEKGLVPGNYTLVVSDITSDSKQSASATAFLASAPMLPVFPKDRRILEGDRLLISCEVTGYPKPDRVSWKFRHIDPDMMKDAETLIDSKEALAPLVDSNSSVYQFLTKDILDDQLLFPQLPSKFNGLYECSVRLGDEVDETLILVNVKDRWAALWPFIGIVIEVAVLVTAILLYERHQMRSKPSKSETNAGTTTGTTEPSSPSVKPKSVAQQQNNVNAVIDQTNEPNAEATKGLNSDGGATEEVRLRGGVRC